MIIFKEIMYNGCIENNKFRVVNSKQAINLADFVRRVRDEKGYSLEKVQQLSGNKINASYVSRIENGYVSEESVTPKKLQALAKGLGVAEEEIFTVVRGHESSGDLSLEELRLLHCFRNIPLERKTDALGYLEMLFKLYGKNGDASSKVSKNGPEAGKVYDAVAGIPKSVKRAGKKGSKKSGR